MSTEKISLKVFWDAVEERLTTYTAEDLRAILRAFAQQVAPTERHAFLAKLNPTTQEAVGEQHRGSYNKAAMLIAACAETLRARGATTQADTLIQQVCARYPRHRSFLGELNARCA